MKGTGTPGWVGLGRTGEDREVPNLEKCPLCARHLVHSITLTCVPSCSVNNTSNSNM